MNEPAFVYETEIQTTPDRLWAALTDGEITRLYWFDRRIESEWRVGSPVRFYDGDGDVVTDEGVVLECDEPKRLSYTFRPAGYEHYTRVTFEIEPAGGGAVRLLLVHDQLADPGDVDGWRRGWTPILTNLEAMLNAE